MWILTIWLGASNLIDSQDQITTWLRWLIPFATPGLLIAQRHFPQVEEDDVAEFVMRVVGWVEDRRRKIHESIFWGSKAMEFFLCQENQPIHGKWEKDCKNTAILETRRQKAVMIPGAASDKKIWIGHGCGCNDGCQWTLKIYAKPMLCEWIRRFLLVKK